MTTGAHHLAKGYRTIRLPLDKQEYDLFIDDKDFAQDRLEALYWQFPALFPACFDQG